MQDPVGIWEKIPGERPHDNSKFIKQDSAIDRKDIIMLVKTYVLAVLNPCGEINKSNV